MRKKVLVWGPALTQTGYGEQARFALRALRHHEDKFDIFLHTVNWGKSSWLWDDNEERAWFEHLIQKTAHYKNSGGKFDISIQCTIPNEWQKIAPINIGYTAGIETTKIAPQWIEKSYLMDKIIFTSNHSKDVFMNTTYSGKTPDGREINDFRCQTPGFVASYAARKYEPEELDVDFDYDFNFLSVLQWSPRKNAESTVKWFVEEFYDQEVGLVLKCNFANNSLGDFEKTRDKIASLLDNPEYKDRKCKIHLVHGYLTPGQMASLYTHPKVKAFLSLTHGEGYGLPLFEAAGQGLPIVTTEWSGQADFLFADIKKKDGKTKKRPLFAQVSYDIGPIPESAVWDGVLQRDSMWCYPKEGSAKMKMRDVVRNYDRYLSQANKLQEWILEDFEAGKMYDGFVAPFLDEFDADDSEELVEIV